MKMLNLIAALGLFASVNALAVDVEVKPLSEFGQPAQLRLCGGRDGSARMVRSNGQLFIVASGLECSYFKTNFSQVAEPMQGSRGNFHLSIPVNENVPGIHTLTIGSENYFKHPKPGSEADIIEFYVAPKLVVLDLIGGNGALTAPHQLGACGGRVFAEREGARVFLIIEGTSCNKFDILAEDGMSLNYDAQPINNGRAAFEIPRLMIGKNAVELRIYRKHADQPGDKILLRFNSYSLR